MTLAGLTEGLPGGRGHGRKVSATTPHFSDMEAAVQEVIPCCFAQ